MSNNIDLHAIIMQQAETISKLSAQLAAFVLDPNLEPCTKEPLAGGAVYVPKSAGIPAQLNPYDSTLKGSDLVREHFRRGGGTINCLRSDISDAHAICRGLVRTIVGVDSDGDFITDQDVSWRYAVAYDDSGAVLTASELLG